MRRKSLSFPPPQVSCVHIWNTLFSLSDIPGKLVLVRVGGASEKSEKV